MGNGKASRHLLSFQKRQSINPDAPADYGVVVDSWQEQFRHHASRIPRLGGETMVASRLQSIQPYTLRVRQNRRTRAIETDWRAVDVRTGTVYQVKAIADPMDRGQYLDLLVVVGQSS